MRRVGPWPWVTRTTAVDVAVGDANDAAVGVGVGRAERFTFVLGALQWSLHMKGVAPLDQTAVDDLTHLALHQGRVGWEAAMRCCHKLNKAVWAPVNGVRQPSNWTQIKMREGKAAAREALASQEQTANTMKTNATSLTWQYIMHA